MRGVPERHYDLVAALAVVFSLLTLFFVWRSFYGMRISAMTHGAAVQHPSTAE